MDYTYSPWNSLGQNTGVGSLSLLQVIFPTQGSNPGLPNFRRILHLLSHQGGPPSNFKKIPMGGPHPRPKEHIMKEKAACYVTLPVWTNTEIAI